MESELNTLSSSNPTSHPHPCHDDSSKDQLSLLPKSDSFDKTLQELERKSAAYVCHDVYGTMGHGDLPALAKILLSVALLTLFPIHIFADMLILLLASAPSPQVYGFDEEAEEGTDEMVGIMRVLRQRLPIQDRLTKMKPVKNCFAGSHCCFWGRRWSTCA